MNRVGVAAALAAAVAISGGLVGTAQAATPVSIVSGGVSYATYGTTYSDPLVATSGTAPYSFSVVAGALPTGLAIAADDFIRGVPTVLPGKYDFTIGVTDSSSPVESATAGFSIQIGKGVPILVPRAFPLSLRPLALSLRSVNARLTGSDPQTPISGQGIAFSTRGSPLCASTTNADGVAQCAITLAQAVKITLNGELDASFDGNDLWASAGGQAFLIPQPQPPL